MSASWHEARERLLAVAKRMSAEGLVVGTSGNASLRLPIADGILITPRGLPYETMTAADMVALDLQGESTEGELAPSSESHMHLAVYEARPDVRGMVHTHSVYASAAAVTGVSIPPILDEMVIVLGGVVRVADYGFPALRSSPATQWRPWVTATPSCCGTTECWEWVQQWRPRWRPAAWWRELCVYWSMLRLSVSPRLWRLK